MRIVNDQMYSSLLIYSGLQNVRHDTGFMLVLNFHLRNSYLFVLTFNDVIKFHQGVSC